MAAATTTTRDPSWSAAATLFVAALLPIIKTCTTKDSENGAYIIDRRSLFVLALNVVVSLLLFQQLELSAAAFVALWHPSTLLLSQCVVLLAPVLQKGGPLGRGCSKLCQVVAGIVLWKVTRNRLPPVSLWLSDGVVALDVVTMILLILLLSAAVNLVLWGWSKYTSSRGNHQGVHEMVHDTLHRSLSVREHFRLALLAILNAFCEEYTSRGLWRLEFQQLGFDLWQSNLAQAAIFGIWHYYGIPSGWAGVGLTFVYGWIMGFLADWGHGSLLYPILAHSVADYFIFAVLVRQSIQSPAKRRQ